jgi:DNA segregation ATPase FtsK/SpoIIIE-like protein
MAAEYIDRPPRIQPELPIDERVIPSPPNVADKSGGDMISQLLPMLSVLSMVGFGAFAGGGNIAGSALMGGVMLLSVSGSLYQVWMARQNAGKASKRYLETLKQLRKDMADSHNTQRIFYAHNYPDVQTLLNIAAYKEPGQETSRFGTRLWERRTSDHDFGVIRLGMGTRTSTVVYTFGDANGENPLSRDAARLAADSRVLKDAPVTICLRAKAEQLGQSTTEQDKQPKIHGAPQHAIGIYGKNRGQVADFARALLANYAAFHSPVDTRVFALGHSGRKADWKFAEWLPHVDTRGVGDNDDNADERVYDQLCFDDDPDALATFWRPIKKDLDQRQLRLNEKKDGDGAGVDVTLPLLLVFVDLLGELPEDSPLKDVTGDSMVTRIVGNGPTLGAAIIFLANDPSQLPSDCGALIEVGSVGERVVFRYVETGLNPARYLGDADQLDQRTAQMLFAAKIRRLDLQRPFGSDLPRTATLLQMQSIVERERIDSVDRLPIARNWQVSVDPRAQEWLSVPVGMMSMRDVRTMVFSAKEGGDGVHGMVAGTTGSGKSEMLMTLIAGLAIKYDPRIVNFVLVDYKGGQAFEAFRKLPHTVDILTNLQPNAVERMFIAIQAVMDQRAELLAQSGVSDLVKYRAEVAPKLAPDDPRPRTFPHLFIIVDEFAEMISANPDYKQKFESITRLGRAFGVSLILATQRPAGAVTDQMRANMKFKISLRVETTDDSKELLESPEAAFLPNLGGRGYIKSGNDLMQGVQIAWAGEKYTGKPKLQLKDIYWLDEEPLPDLNKLEGAIYTPGEIAQALALPEPPRVLLDWIVGATGVQARRLNVPAQTKPWPDPLPEQLTMTSPIDARYLNTERDVGQDKRIVIDRTVGTWLDAREDALPTWPTFSWKSPAPLRVDIGLIDNPFRSENRLLTIDIGAGPTVLFGAAGRGKTTFVKSLLVALAATRSPNELHIYALDFGRGGLKSVQALPHLGAAIDASESARVDQLLRMLRNFINERQEQLGKSPYGTLNEYNANTPGNVYPDIIVVIDNFAEFRDSYDHLSADLLSLIRDGRQFGVHFVLTAGMLTEIGMKLIGMFANRLTMAQADTSAVSDIVGSGARPFDNVPGRGMVAVAIKDGDKPVPLEFHVALPGDYVAPAQGMEPQERAALIAQNAERLNQAYVTISRNMETVANGLGIKRPAAELPKSLTFFDMWSKLDKREIKTIAELDLAAKWRDSMQPENSEWLRGAIGLISDKDVKQMVFQAQADGVHGMAAGTTGSGKSELLQTLIASMALKYDPRIVNFVLIDYKGGPTVEPFKRLPHAVDIATNLDGNAVERIFIAIDAEMNRRSAILAKAGVADLVEYRKKVIPSLKPDSPFPRTFPHLFIIVDEFGEMMTQNSDYRSKFESITRLGRSFGVSLILATQRPSGAVSDQMRANMKFRISLRVETPQDSKELLNRPDAARLPQIAGRGYVQAGTDLLTEVQAAWSGAPYAGDTPESPYAAAKVLESMGTTDAPRSLLGWIVGSMQLEAQRSNVPKQTKPWPDPMPSVLPINLPIDATYMPEPGATKDSISARRVRQTVLSPALARWIDNADGKPIWQRWEWRDKLPLTATFGVIDNPFAAEQMPLAINAAEPLLVFGASGRGKTTFLKSLLFTLAAERSPSELNIYALDFGRGGLKTLGALPHCGATIDAARADRIEALFRMLKGIINERQERLAKFPSIEDYNAQHKDNPEALFPAIIFVIDNFAEFKENFEYLLPELMSMVRDGRQFGISFVITASVLNDIGNKLANLFTQKLCFTVSGGDYSDIVGKPPLPLTDLPGRGYAPVMIENRAVPLEFHVATPVIEGERDPYMRIAERMGAASDAAGIKRPSAEIPKSVTLLEMIQAMKLKKTERIGDIGIADNWRASMLPENQDWLRADIGFVSSKELRSLYFTAKAGGDGVHGLAAGTTGSGKSELIQTLITSMALRYDPRIVNFVLIDYKGGPTVEPFRQLPHAVDIATNLDGNAVDRIFVAIGAEMNRRSAILAKAGVADLVEYRKKVIPTLKPDSPLPRTFPHLFVIVDEFAEMITNNPDYKAKFDSITRLGRSFGVSLILATQKPSGVVTDQMKANMKFRLCLRVETADDSKELLNRPDAATLPSLGGRGYLQVGGGPLTEVQAAWSGAPYDETRPDPAYPAPEILKAMGKDDDPPRALLGWVVGAMQLEAQRQNIGKQFKPWPDLLPPVIQLHGAFDASYIPALRTSRPGSPRRTPDRRRAGQRMTMPGRCC